jgi:hypothetical protein
MSYYIERNEHGKITAVYACRQFDDMEELGIENEDLVEFLTPPASPYIISKTTPWRRMTSDEASIMDNVMGSTDAQLKHIYMAAQYLSSGDDLWETLRQLLASNLPGGDGRAQEILAPET